ncbi:flagellar hook-basal body protein [Caballeronia telluris]|uniref:Flagellar basal body rod protein FlgF n=1 Tax=Caballeronia telluris TaxID=326475 RepID=A0A158EUI9_9BURK|nr:flagellar hook basal-body protein [Caballeronia telluris]SAL10759.1 flagellar basal body rod protein FlgF [Caballeronia telluris]
MDSIMALGTRLIASETRRVETAGQNIANAASPGYKRAIAFQNLLASAVPVVENHEAGFATSTDFSAGKLIHTGNPLDVSIDGRGFFEVATADGPAYTRVGSFTRDASGRLTTAQGWPLQGSGGDVVVSSSGDWRIEKDGTVLENGDPVAVINVVEFGDPSKLRRIDGGLFVADGQSAAPVDGVQISQGNLESSNVTLATDMMQMMEAVRRIEAGQKLIHTYDDMMGSALQRLGEMSA